MYKLEDNENASIVPKSLLLTYMQFLLHPNGNDGVSMKSSFKYWFSINLNSNWGRLSKQLGIIPALSEITPFD
jgi:hypothetical protein